MPRIVAFVAVMEVATATALLKWMIAAMALTDAPVAARPLPVPGKSMSELVTLMILTPERPWNNATLAP